MLPSLRFAVVVALIGVALGATAAQATTDPVAHAAAGLLGLRDPG